MDIIYIHELNIETIVGIAAWEQRIKQTLCFDLELAVDITHAAASHQIADTVDYQQVAECLQTFLNNQTFLLLETVAEQTAALILENFRVNWLKLRVSKPGIMPNAKEVGILIERGKK